MNTKRTSLFLMANLGVEVSRIISFKERGEQVLAKEALLKTQKIIAEIKALPDMKPRIKEVNALSNVIESILQDKPTVNVPTQHIKSYFVPFSLRLMAG